MIRLGIAIFNRVFPVVAAPWILYRAIKDMVIDAPHLSHQSQIDYSRATGRQSRDARQQGDTK